MHYRCLALAITTYGCSPESQTAPTGVATIPARIVSISAGSGYTCGVWSHNTLLCWGDNTYGQLSPPSIPFGILLESERPPH